MSMIYIAYKRLKARAGRRQRDKVEGYDKENNNRDKVESKTVNDGSSSYRRFAGVRESPLS